MAETIKLPLVGTVKTGYAVAGGAAVVGIVGFAYWRHSQNANASQSSSSGTGTSGSAYVSPSVDQNNIDPSTGFPYGSPEDQAALSGLYGGGGGFLGGGFIQPTTQTVTQTVTETKELIGVPSVVGAGQVTAISAIKRAGLVPDPSITIPGDGNVTSQTPAAGTEVHKGSIVHWSAKPVAHKTHFKSFIAAGTTSLRQAAEIRHASVNEVIADTEANHPSQEVRNYIAAGDFNKKLPRGSKWYF